MSSFLDVLNNQIRPLPSAIPLSDFELILMNSDVRDKRGAYEVEAFATTKSNGIFTSHPISDSTTDSDVFSEITPDNGNSFLSTTIESKTSTTNGKTIEPLFEKVLVKPECKRKNSYSLC